MNKKLVVSFFAVCLVAMWAILYLTLKQNPKITVTKEQTDHVLIKKDFTKPVPAKRYGIIERDPYRNTKANK